MMGTINLSGEGLDLITIFVLNFTKTQSPWAIT